MAKAPRPRRPEDAEAKDRIVVIVNGVPHPVRFNELSAKDAGALRQATGLSLRSVLAAAEKDPDIDVVAALVWLSRRQNGAPNLPYETVASEITYGTELAYGEDEDEGEGDEHDPQL